MPDETGTTQISEINDLSDLPPDVLEETAPEPAETRPKITIAAKTAAKLPLGRPRKDGNPPQPRPQPTMDPPTPSPSYKKYFSDSPHDNQKPGVFLAWWRQLPQWAKDRLTIYVYRLWPVLKIIEKDEDATTRNNQEYAYIDKLGEPPETIARLQDMYGAGDYKLIVNDDVKDKRTLCIVYVKENMRDLKNSPPTDRRIDNPENVELDDPANKSYVQYLRSKGKLPEQVSAREKQANMAETTALGQMTGMMGKMMDKMIEDRGRDNSKQPTSDKVVEVVASAAVKGQELMLESMKRVDQLRGEIPDPMESIERVVSIVDKLRPPAKEGGGESTAAMAQMTEMFKTVLTIQSSRAERAEQKVDQLLEKLATRGNPADGEVAAKTGVKESVGEFLSLAEALGWKRGGGAVAAAPETGWADRLPDIMESGAKILGTVMQGWAAIQHQQAVRDAQKQAQAMGMPVPMPQAQPMPQPQPQAQPQHQALAGAANGVVNPDQSASEAADFAAFMESIKDALLNHIDQDLGGAQFAEWLIDSRRDGKVIYKQIAGQGPMVLLAALRGYPPIGQELVGKDLVVNQFVEDFCKMEEIRAREMEAEGLEPEA